MRDRLVAKRLIHIAVMFGASLVTTVLMAVLHGRYIDEVILLVALNLMFFALYIYVLEHHRLQKHIADNRETSFRRAEKGFLISCAVILAASFFPEYLKPVLLVPIVLTAYGIADIAVYAGLFLSLSMCLAVGNNIWECTLYCFLVLLGCMLAEGLEQKVVKKYWYALTILCVSAVLPGMFYYLAYREIHLSLFLFGFLEGSVVTALLLFVYPRIAAEKQTEVADTLEDILDENYPLYRDLRKFSKADFGHAKRVSRLARECAALVGADEEVCAAAGFYYRIGILEGEPIGENGVLIAQRECFPEQLIRIISEYNGETTVPSDIESAIVHMVDGLVKKIEVFDKTTMSSGWNQDMVIYQTLNDFSAKGLYDNSGLSMNMFLKIREYLVNKERLI